MEVLGNIIRFSTRWRAENALDIIRVHQKANDLFIVNLRVEIEIMSKSTCSVRP
jgi:hypothetical protein